MTLDCCCEALTLTARAHQIQLLLDRVRRQVSPRRQAHILGVTHTITLLAAEHGLPMDQATLAGLLHDISKERHSEDLRKELERWGRAPASEDQAFPHLWHGFHAAAVAELSLKISDPDLLQAVRLHTTADRDLAPLGQALFVADFCEPGRKIESAPALLALARRDLTEGFRQVLSTKLRHIVGHGRAVSPRAIRASRACGLDELLEQLAVTG